MFIYILLIILLFLGFCAGWVIYQKTIKELYSPPKNMKGVNQTIMTYNIQKFPWSFKTLKDVAQFDHHSIILVQECYDEIFSSFESYFPHYYICKGQMKGVALVNSGLVILSKYPILEYEFVPFVNYNMKTLDCLSEKGFLSAVIDMDGKKMNIINTHLQSCDYERYDPHAFMQFQEILDYVSKLDNYIIGGDFNIDVKDMKARHRLNVYYPTEPTIYIDFKTSKSQSMRAEGYEGMVYDYFIANRVEVEAKTVQTGYSDHNPVSGRIF
jgi:endonuclease/exonuclease/phosphatase family metal-dependent hydrolase